LTAATGSDPAQVHYGDGQFALPANPASFAVSDDRLLWAVVMPGPDFLSLLYWAVVAAPEIVNLPLQGPGRLAVPSPNPASGQTRIGFAMNRAADATLAIYDLRGRKVAELAAGYYGEGSHHLFWNGRDTAGHALPTGVYCVELRIGAFRTTQKIMLAR
jgi:hypothetical protein